MAANPRGKAQMGPERSLLLQRTMTHQGSHAAKHHPIARIGAHSRDTDEGPWPGRFGSDRGKQLAGTKAATAAKQLAGMKA